MEMGIRANHTVEELAGIGIDRKWGLWERETVKMGARQQQKHWGRVAI